MASLFRLKKSITQPLDAELARRFRDMEPSPTERDLNAGRLKYLRAQADAGLLIPFNWATATLNGRTVRMNGQHSSAMLCDLIEAGAFPEGLRVHLDEYEVDGPDGLALLFRQFDSRKSGRTAADVAGAYQGLHPQLQDVNKAVAKLGVEGIVWQRKHVEGLPVDGGDDVYSLFGNEQYHPFLRWLNDVFSIKTPELRKQQVVSAMFATWEANRDEAKKFWDQVARGGIEYEDTAPSTVLDNWLKAAKDGTLKEDLKPAQYYQGCVYAWNAYREEKAIKDIKADTRKALYTPSA